MVRHWRLAVLGLLFVLPTVFAEVVVRPDPLLGNGGLREWRREIQLSAEDRIRRGVASETGYTECAEVIEIPGLILCGSYFQETMNKIFMRPSIYAEGGMGHEAGTVVTAYDPGFLKGVMLIKGHDIPGHSFEEFVRKAATTGLTPHEAELAEALKGLRQKLKTYVLISFSVQNVNDYRSVTTHEGIHAQYFLNPRFKSIVDTYWQTDLAPEQQALARGILAHLGYATSDESLMANECGAYLLQWGAMEPEGRFHPMGEQPRDLLIQRFSEAGEPIILLQ